MNKIQKRFLLFLIGCIGIRTLFVVVARYINIKYLPILGYIALIPAIGFLYLFLTGSRKRGFEVFNDKIWWDKLRPIHAIFYLLFAFNAINRNSNSWVYLLFDVIFGLISFLIFHYSQGNFRYLF